MKIEAINNPKVKSWLKLKVKKYRDIEEKFLIEGDHLLQEALKKGQVVEIIGNDPTLEIKGLPFYLVSDAILKKLTSQVSFSPVLAVVKKLPEGKIEGNICLLDNIQDPGNLGAIIRSALAFNIKTIIMSPDTVDLYNEKVIRSSEGMLFHLNFLKKDLDTIIPDLKKKGYKIYGTDVKKGHSLKDIKKNDLKGIIIGNEGKGMQEDLKKLCDDIINIPLNNNCESLNASIAASIIFYEFNR